MIVHYLFILGFSLLFIMCQQKGEDVNRVQIIKEKSNEMQAATGIEEKTFNCNYRGEVLPGVIPKMFAADVISTKRDDSCFEISISGKEMVFNRDGEIYTSSQSSDGSWTVPAPICEGGEPSFSKDGQSIYFNSREAFSGAKVALNIWSLKKQNDQWEKPAYLGGQVLNQVMHAPSFTSDGSIYASGITVLKYKNGTYQNAARLSPPIKGAHPFISSDDSFIIFDKKPPNGGHGADLFIIFSKKDGTWTDPVWLGEKINTNKLETNAYVTPDEKFMFFTRQFDVFWVEAGFIAEMRKKIQSF